MNTRLEEANRSDVCFATSAEAGLPRNNSWEEISDVGIETKERSTIRGAALQPKYIAKGVQRNDSDKKVPSALGEL